jgi:hypothetical protein
MYQNTDDIANTRMRYAATTLFGSVLPGMSAGSAIEETKQISVL